jgi:DNA-binding NarL/FixJ family response regulator
MENKPVKIAVIDDDPFVLTHLNRTLAQRFPSAEIVGVSDPIAPVGYDVSIIDREFGENRCGLDLIKRVKRLAPASLVVAYSAFLDRDYLRSLILEHCEGAFDKGSLEELEKMVELIGNFLDDPDSLNANASSPRNTVRSIFELVREWNIRLSQNGHASARYHSDVRQ